LASATPAVMTDATADELAGAPEVMELIDGACRVKLPGADWVDYRGGQSFSVAGNASFQIEVTQALHYVCHFG
jgi:uncharacterized protein YaiE (UPF0345 family)